ncbi:NAD-dependent epimerase [Paenibacillus marchantiophytorum]|uniref:NAD-dependent epimerase n=1 Tax=Paenibacillus marchantiophytorum TaxID=1619310 RepID=A0ABQ1EKR4_9BACL|nr:NAD(P)-dependent oxidoreductase [Paenibacillus marchantiophytorum]GFZ76397.1 NAD-dependent epimerase [Paenibacillus marchantiophytorum]
MKILITGAAGRIGSVLADYLKDRFTLRLADLETANLTRYPGGDHEYIALNITDVEACQRACQGIDVVIHLAADPSPKAGFYESLLDNNIKGTFNMFRAAKDQGISRILTASSVQTIEGYPLDSQLYANMPTRPHNLYGVSKCFAESLACYFGYAEHLQSIAIRIGAFDDSPAEEENLTARDMSAYLHPADLCDLIFKTILSTNLGPFTILHAISDNRFKRLDLTETKALVDYNPKTNAFERNHIHFHDSKRDSN